MLGIGIMSPPIIGAGGSSPPFVPTDLSGLQIWARADLGVTESGTVSAWADQSGNANDLVQSNPTYQPTFVASGIGGFADITYSGNNYLYATSTDLVTTALTAFFIFETTVLNSNDQPWGKGFAQTEWLFTGQNQKLRFALAAAPVDTNYLVTDGEPHYAVAVWDKAVSGGAITLYLDGIQQAGSATTTTDITGGDNNATGGEVGSAGSGFFPGYTGHLPEVGLYNRALSGGELSQLFSYLQARSGASFLPTWLNDLTSWFRADLGMTTSGSDVSTWTDQSGAGIQPSLSPLIASPQYEASGINGLPDLTFVAASSQSLVGTNALLGTTGVTLFGIFQTTSAGVHCVWGMQYNDYHYAIFLNVNSVTAGQLWFYNGNADHIISPATYNDGAPHCFVSTYDSGSGDMKLYVDDGSTPVVTGTGSGTIQNTAGDLNAIGSSTGASANDRYFSGSIAEVGSFSRAIGSTEVTHLMNYLKGRAGI